jgi:hypothetical protein
MKKHETYRIFLTSGAFHVITRIEYNLEQVIGIFWQFVNRPASSSNKDHAMKGWIGGIQFIINGCTTNAKFDITNAITVGIRGIVTGFVAFTIGIE